MSFILYDIFSFVINFTFNFLKRNYFEVSFIISNKNVCNFFIIYYLLFLNLFLT